MMHIQDDSPLFKWVGDTLDGWMDSNGAHLEMHIAHRVGIRVVEARAIVEPVLRVAA